LGEGGERPEVWLERRHILTLLLLYHAGKAIKSDIGRVLGSKQAAYVERVIMDLEERGLIEEERVGRRVRVFRLTEKGKEVAEVLDKLARELSKEKGAQQP